MRDGFNHICKYIQVCNFAPKERIGKWLDEIIVQLDALGDNNPKIPLEPPHAVPPPARWPMAPAHGIDAGLEDDVGIMRHKELYFLVFMNSNSWINISCGNCCIEPDA